MKKLLLSTILVAATSAPAVAQPADDVFRRSADPEALHASQFIGMRVYRTDELEAETYDDVQQGWDEIGEINDVVFSREGSVEAVLVDIGGFLGIGENQVAVDIDSIQFIGDSGTPDQEADFFLVLNVPREALQEAPLYGGIGGSAAGPEEEVAAAGQEPAAASENADQETAAPEAEATDSQTRSSGMGLSREGFVTATESDLVVDELTGVLAYDMNDKRIGEISEFMVAEDGTIEAAVIDVGGFLGIGEKPVELDMSKLDIMRAENGGEVRVYISMSEEELEALPEFEK